MTRRDADIIGYMYNDTEQKIREKIAQEIEAAHKGDGKSIWCDLTLEYCSCVDTAAIARGNNG
jgi:hypothetical protein